MLANLIEQSAHRPSRPLPQNSDFFSGVAVPESPSPSRLRPSTITPLSLPFLNIALNVLATDMRPSQAGKIPTSNTDTKIQMKETTIQPVKKDFEKMYLEP